MANVKISDLPAATSLATTDIFPLVQSGLTKQATFSLVPVLQTGTGTVTRTLNDKFYEVVSVMDFMTSAEKADVRANTGAVDIGTSWDKAMTYAASLLPAKSTQPDGGSGYTYGGVLIYAPAGTYARASAMGKLPPQISLKGAGTRATILKFTYNGTCVANLTSADSTSYPYAPEWSSISDLTIRGDRTLASQVLLSLLRFDSSTIENVEVESSGGDGIVLTECVGSNFARVRSNGNVGKGFYLTFTAGSPILPCNANTFTCCQAYANDADGLHLEASQANVFHGGVFESNYASSVYSSIGTSETATMRQVYISNTARGNVFNGTWFEGDGNAHVYVASNDNNATQINAIFNGCHFVPQGTAGSVDRASVCNKGFVVFNDPNWQAASFNTINGSSAPFRVGKTNAGRIVVTGAVQTGVSGGASLMIEDNFGNDANLALYAGQQFWSAASTLVTAASQKSYVTAGDTQQDYYRTTTVGGTTWEGSPFASLSASKRGWVFGDGSGAGDTNVYRAGADRLASDDTIHALAGTAIPAGGTAGAGYRISSTGNFGIFFGSGVPSLSAAKGSLYLRSDGTGTTDRAYINTDGSTAWTALTTVA